MAYGVKKFPKFPVSWYKIAGTEDILWDAHRYIFRTEDHKRDKVILLAGEMVYKVLLSGSEIIIGQYAYPITDESLRFEILTRIAECG